MKVGTVKELKNHEYRVGLIPDNVLSYRKNGHEVFVQAGSGEMANFSDEEYRERGAVILPTPAEVYSACDMIVKVKEPLEEEYPYLRPGLILFAYLHLAPNRPLADALLASGVKAVAFETIENGSGSLPCLRPMSEIAGRLSIQEGAKYLERPFGGRGILLGGVPGVERGKVVIVGGGITGTYAAKAAVGMGAQVTLLDISLSRLVYLEDIFGASVTTLYSSETNIAQSLAEADLVIGAVLIPGATTPKLIRREHLKIMKQGAVIVDIAIDQGGCCETSAETTHDDPVFILDGIVHYCVGNMPGAVPRTSTVALANTTLPYGLMIADMGLEKACASDEGLAKGVNLYMGTCVNRNVADSLGLQCTPCRDAMVTHAA
jgi:alanine dehydrogenase